MQPSCVRISSSILGKEHALLVDNLYRAFEVALYSDMISIFNRDLNGKTLFNAKQNSFTLV